MNSFERKIAEVSRDGLRCIELLTLQANLGLMCNQQCTHCHLGCSPQRTEMMDWPVMEAVLAAAGSTKPELVDLTGGTPELNRDFRRFVKALREAGHNVQVRTNLTVLLEAGQETTPEFLRDHGVNLVGSLPCYLAENVDSQRGRGVHRRSIEAIRRLNSLGYGTGDGGRLDLVYNPAGASLPPEPAELEEDYKRELGRCFGVYFTRLLTMTNMPIGRFADELRRQEKQPEYLRLLRDSYNGRTLDELMCRHQICVRWDGTLYDCDFNLALGLPVNHDVPNQVGSFAPSVLAGRRIVTGEHCFACTAGRGSSCGGALV